MVRPAEEKDLEKINDLRRQVNDLHVQGRPDIFRPGFGAELKNHLYEIWNKPEHYILVAERDGEVVGFAAIGLSFRPENPFMLERRIYDIDELAVDRAHRRQGIGRELIEAARRDAAEKGYARMELNMWAFNEDALAFYEALGFQTYRRYMERSTGETPSPHPGFSVSEDRER